MAARTPATLWTGQVVHHDDMARSQGGEEHLLDIGEESGAVHRPVEHHGCRQATKREGGDKRDRLPVPMRDRCPASLPAWRSPAEPGPLRRRPGLIDAHQVLRVEVGLRVEPGLAPGGDVGPRLLAGVRCFF